MIVCCKNCTDRYPGCHDHCETYQKAKSDHIREKELAKDDMLYQRYVVTRSFKRRDEDIIRKKKHSGYSKFKGHH